MTQLASRHFTEQEAVREITNILRDSNNKDNWKLLLESSDVSRKLNADVIGSVLLHNRADCDPNRLLRFFYWAELKTERINAKYLYFHRLVPNDIQPLLTDGHCRKGNITEAFSTFRCMLARGILPDVQTYNVLINGLSRYGKLKEMLGVFSELLEKGVVP
ncbi:hypothetical protein ACOSQ4_015900 [Xanthoceras sorbifolium]